VRAWFESRSGRGPIRRIRAARKIQYAPVLVGALDLARVPRPLDGVLRYLTTESSTI
jgi:hypothetical protein